MIKASDFILVRGLYFEYINIVRLELKKYIVYLSVIPKGTSLNAYTQEDITLLVNHVNSTKRPGLNNLSPYEMIPEDDDDMRRLMKLLDLKEIPADKVNLTKELLNK